MNEKGLPSYGVRWNLLFRPMWLALLVFLLSGLAVQAQTATVTSDKDDYAPRSNAVFTGAGFAPNENVTLKVKNLNRPCNTISADSSYLPWTVKANGSGGFVTNWTVCDCFGDDLRLKATGQTSGLIAYDYFTDGGVQFKATGLPDGINVTLPEINYYSKSGNGNGTAVIESNKAFTTPGSYVITANDASNFNTLTFQYPSQIIVNNNGTSSTYILQVVTAYSTKNGSNTTIPVNGASPPNWSLTVVNDPITVTAIYTISQTSTNLLVSIATGIYGGTATLTATLSSGTTNLSGKSINFSLNGTSVGTAITDVSGVATLSSASLSGINAATYLTGVSASFVADASYSASTGNNSLTVNKKALTAATTVASKVYDGSAVTGTVTLGAVTGLVGSETLVITPTATNYADANAGTNKSTTISYSLSNGTGNANNYSMANLVTSGNITKAPSVTTVTIAGAPFTYTGAAHTPATVTVTGAGGLNLTPTAAYANNVNAGTATASYSYAGDDNYLTSSDSKDFAIGKAATTTTITIAGAPFTYTGAAHTPATVTVTGAGGLNLTPTAAYANNVNAGTATASYSYAGDDNYLTSSDSKDFAIGKAATTTTITIAGAPFTYTGAAHTPATVTVTGAGGLNLTPTAAYANNVNAGTATASYSYAGDDNYLTSSDSKDFAIGKAATTTTITIAGAPFTYTGAAHTPATVTVTGAGGLNLTPTAAYANNVNAGTATASYSYAGDDNYLTSSDSKDFAIGQKAATVVADAKSKTYGDANPALSAVVSGTVNGDVLNYSLSTTAAQFSGVGSYPIEVSLGSNANYTVTSTDATLTVGQKAATVVADAKSKTYGDANPALSAVVSGTVNGDVLNYSLSTTAAQFSGVGSYPIEVSLGSNANYTVTSTDATLTVGQKAATVVADAKSKTYGDANPALSAVVSGTVNGDVLNYSLSTTAAQFSGVGSYPIEVSLGSNANYAVTSTDATLTVGQKAATVVADAKSKTYGDANPALSAVVSGTVNGDVLNYSLSTTAAQFSGVGSYPIEVSLGSNANYTVTSTDATLTVGQKAATVVADAKSKTYGDANPALSAVVSGTVNGDVLNYSLSTTAAQFSGVGSYPIEVSLGSNANYAVTSTDATLTVGQKAATVVADAKSKTYGDANPALSAVVSGTVNGDVLNYSLSTTAAQFSGVGSYPIEVSLGSNANYTVTSTDATLTVGQKAATVVADAKSKTYGDANPALSAVVSGTVNGDVLNYSLSTTAAQFSGVGSYPIEVSLGSNANYAVTSTDATLTVGQKAATVVADAKSKTYGDANPALSAVVSGTVNGDVLNYSLSTTAAQFSGVGSYPIEVSLGSNANYAVTSTDATLTVGQKAATVVADAKSKTYGDANPALSAVVSGTVNGDVLNYSLSTTAAQFSGVGSYPIEVSLGSNANYAVTSTDATLTVGQKAITITADAKTKVYGDADPALTAQATNVVNGDVATGSLTRVSGESVGSYAISKDTYTYGSNYDETFVGANLAITPLAVTVSAQAKTKVYGNADPALTFVSVPAVGTVLPNGQAISFTGSLNRVAGENVGNYAIEQNTLNNSNYAITYIPSNLSITPLAVIVNAQAKTKVYGNADPALTFVSNPAVGSTRPNGEAISFTGALSRATGENVGNYAIGQNTLANSNYTITYNTANFAITQGGGAITSVRDNNPTQYSDMVNVWARIAPNPNNALVVAGLQQGGSVTFSVRKGATGTPVLLGTSTQFTWDAANNRIEFTGNYKVNSAPDTYVIIAEYTPANTNLNGCTNDAETLVVTKEDADVDYTGALSIATSSASSSTATITMTATVRDISAVVGNSDVNPGDVRNARVRFLVEGNPVVNLNTPANGAITDMQGWTSVSLVNAADLKTGTVILKHLVNIGSSDAMPYKISVEVEGVGFYTGNENVVVTVYKPLNDFVTGGGYIRSTNSIGTYASDAGTKSNFGFNIKSNKTGKSLQGNINMIFRRTEGGMVRTYQIKGNVMTSLSVNALNTMAASISNPKAAVFNGKANLTDITNPLAPISYGGNLTLQVNMTDRGEPGVNDKIAVIVYESDGTILYATNWDGVRATELNLSGGNIAVTNTTVSSARIANPTPTPTTAPTPTPAQPIAAQFDSYPNPFSKAATFRFALEREQKYELAVYDIRGILIKKVSAGSAEAGKLYEFNLDGQYLSYGVYFARLITQDGVKTIRIVKE